MKRTTNTIQINLRSYEQVYGNYYMDNNPHLDMRLVEHLLLCASSTRGASRLTIQVWQKPNEETEKFKLALKNTLKDILDGKNKEFKTNILIAAMSIAAGACIGTLGSMIAGNNEQLSSIVVIAFWVFIWYAVETAIFDNVKLKLEQRRISQIIKADIDFRNHVS